MCVCLRVCKGVRTPPNHQTSPFRAGQRPAVCFLLLYFTPRLFLPLLVLRGVSVLYRQTPTLFCSLPSSQTGLSIERERKERRGRSELFGQTDAQGRMWRFAALWVCRIGPATQTHTHRTGVGGQNLPSSHTHTHSSTPHPLHLLSILHPLSSPHLLPVAAPCSPSLLNKERFRGEGVKGARGNSYVCM